MLSQTIFALRNCHLLAGLLRVLLSPLFLFYREGSLGYAQKAVMSCFSSSSGFPGEMCVCVEGKEMDAEQRAMLLPCVCLQVTCCPAAC